ncbi:MAG: DNA translocase FtsK 4TM domain-containing protein [Candidatus Falkowbacteria bacterium]
MAKNNNKNSNPLDKIALPNINLDDRAKNSIVIILIVALGLVSLLGLFNLSGRFGSFLSSNLTLAFGWGKWAWPLFLLAWGWFLYKGKKYQINFFNYLGLFCFFVSYQSLFHFLFSSDRAKELVLEGVGGGYVGFYLSLFFKNILGFWGGMIILLALLFVSLVLMLNTPLSRIIGAESIFAKFFASANSVINHLFSRRPVEQGEEEEVEEVEEEEIEEEEEVAPVKAKKEMVAESREEKKVRKGVFFKQKAIKAEPEPKNTWRAKNVKIDLPLELLSVKTGQALGGDIEKNAVVIQHTLENFGIPVEMSETSVGPTVTQYTFKPAEGIKLSRVTTLSNDLSLALAAHPIRIEAPIPGKALVGIEVPNKTKAIVGLREILEDKSFKTRNNNLMIALGKDVAGANWLYDVTKTPHLLVAGATNSGKSVCLNAIIVSLLYQNSPDSLRFIMVDPKRVELPAYNGIPHLLTPVITEVSKTINALKWCMNEMDRRYDLLNLSGKKNIQSHNEVAAEKMPYIIFVIDELADLMVTAAKDIEGSIIRLTQMSRAVGIHLILATQRPSVDVITGLIKANIPARIAFSVASAIDSKTILDCSGAEKLLGKGDMLFSAAEMSKPKRLQGAYLSDDEITRITDYIKTNYGEAEYTEGITERQKVGGLAGVGLDGNHGDEDELMQEAKEIIINMGRASTSLLQRRLRVGYGRAASILDALEEAGVIGPSNGSKPREVMVSKEQFESMNNLGPSGMPLHDKNSTKAPGSYLGDDEGDDGTLAFDSEEEVEEVEDAEEEATEEVEKEDEKKEEVTTNPTLPRAFSDDEDDGMFFSK